MKIEKNIPIKKRNQHRKKYPFEKLEVNDSFFVEFSESNKKYFQASLLSLAKSWAFYNNPECKFKTSKTDKGVRIWRTK